MGNDDIFKGASINEDMLELSLQGTFDQNKGKPIPKGVMSLEKLYDL